jgi:hypothetical protein
MAAFSIKLEHSGPRPELGQKHYDQELDDPGSILDDVCSALAENGRTTFVMSAFGQDRWPVDSRTDLCVVLEQLPSLIGDLQQQMPSRLDLYEQGLERRLSFSPQGEETEIHCTSLTKWRPDPESIRISTPELLENLASFLRSFCDLLDDSIRQHPWILEWRSGEWSRRPL